MIQGTGLIPPVKAWFAQPLDVSALIDQVEQRWGARVDTQQVGLLGQSLGGYTVTALAGLSSTGRLSTVSAVSCRTRRSWCSIPPWSGSVPGMTR